MYGFLRFLCALAAIPLFSITLSARETEVYNGHEVMAKQAILRIDLSKTNAPLANVVAQLTGISSADQFRTLNSVLGLYLVHSKTNNVTALLNLLQNIPGVGFVEPDYIVRTVVTPNDPSFGQQIDLYNPLNLGSDIGATLAWGVSTGSTANVVGVVDTGVDYTHPDLAANIWSAPSAFTVTLSWGQLTCPAGSHGYNAITHTCDPADDNNHGTHVSGTIGAVGNNGTGVAGVNWTTRIMGLKFLDSTGTGAVSDAIDAIEFSLQAKSLLGSAANVRVLSNSWAGSGYSQALLNEINKANTANILFVAAAGNSAANIDINPTYPASYSAPNLITVAATTSTDALASFSNYGPASVQLGAPGVNILSTLPNASYGFASGTSMATPHVSGAAMLVLSACALDTSGLKNAILSTVDAVAGLKGLSTTGGRLNVNAAIRSCVTPQVSGAISAWSTSAVPGTPLVGDLSPVTLGVKFRSDVSGTISGVRFYKGVGNNGTHIGMLYNSTGALLAQAIFTGETASGWQQVTFSSPVAIAANTTYVAAFFTTSGYAVDTNFFTSSGVTNGPLHLLQSGVDGLNGVYAYGGSPQFPSGSYANSNYWVDVSFTATTIASAGTTSLWSGSAVPVTPWSADSNPVTVGVKIRSDVSGTISGIRFYKGAGNNGTHIGLLYSSTGALLGQAAFSGETSSGWQQATFSSPVTITPNTTYVAALFTTSGYAVNTGFFTSSGVNNPPLHALQSGVDGLNGVYAYGPNPQFPSGSYANANYWVDVAFSAGSSTPSTTSIWSASTVPSTAWVADGNPVTVGVKIRSDVSGTINGIRFYKGSGNNGTHVGLLYSRTGALLAQVAFSAETASGWQQATFSSPVTITANTTYVAALFTSSGYAFDTGFFTSSGANNAPLHALQSGVDGLNGVYAYGGSPLFPSGSYADSNYWVDVVFASN